MICSRGSWCWIQLVEVQQWVKMGISGQCGTVEAPGRRELRESEKGVHNECKERK